MGTHENRDFKRNNLFLLRLWAEDLRDGDGRNKAQWHGRLRRVVDGESHDFADWQGLLDLLADMLSGKRLDHPSPIPNDEDPAT